MLNKKCFIFFRREFPDKPCADIAHYIHDIQCANAALRLGHKTVMVYCAEGNRQGSVFSRAFPFQLKKASREFQDFYGADKDLDMAAMPSKNALLLTKYYFPFHIAPRAKLVHTQDFLIAEAAVRCRVPVIYEQHYLEKDNFKKGVVQSPYFRLAVCQSEVTRHNMIERGMPADKAVWMHNGFESEHLIRQPKEANEWRSRLLSGSEQHLAVYSGALFGFKGIDIIIECAKKMPGIKFVLTGGTEKQLSHYRNKAEG
jgi:glycosyltransferase involved in cell wall biosynthesis